MWSLRTQNAFKMVSQDIQKSTTVYAIIHETDCKLLWWLHATLPGNIWQLHWLDAFNPVNLSNPANPFNPANLSNPATPFRLQVTNQRVVWHRGRRQGRSLSLCLMMFINVHVKHIFFIIWMLDVECFIPYYGCWRVLTQNWSRIQSKAIFSVGAILPRFVFRKATKRFWIWEDAQLANIHTC